MIKKNLFSGLYVYDFWLPVDVFKGYVFSDMKRGLFTQIVKKYVKEKEDIDINKISQLVKAEKKKDMSEYIAIPIRWAGVIDFKDFSEKMVKAYRPGIIFKKYWIYEIFVDEEKEHFFNFRGLLATDCPEKKFREMMQTYANQHKSRLRSDILAYAKASAKAIKQDNGYDVQGLNYEPIVLIGEKRLLKVKE